MSDLTTTTPNALTTLAELGRAADELARQAVFKSYQVDKAANTLKRHGRDLAKLAQCLRETGAAVDGQALLHDPAAWQGITWGMVDLFRKWLFNHGFALSTINGCLSTVRVYAELAFNGGFLKQADYLRIKALRSIKLRADENRSVTRIGDKKATAVLVHEQEACFLIEAAAAKQTPAAKRDAAVLCLLLDHGLRASEVAELKVGSVDLESEQLIFKRPKVHGSQHESGRHVLTPRTLRHLRDYLAVVSAEENEPLFQTSHKGGVLLGGALDRITVSRLVKRIGRRVAKQQGLLKLAKLSAHDCRHYCATTMANKGYGVHELMLWFGWASAQTAMRYVDAAEVAERDRG